MNKVSLGSYLFRQTRARVYFLWMLIVITGFVATHYHQRKTINPVWFSLALIGLVYMWRVMPMQVKQMRQILYAWLIPIAFGMAVSGLVFYVDSDSSANLIANLGGFWLLVMAVGYLWNGLVDPPTGWYYFAVLINVVAGLACIKLDSWRSVQYLIAAIISGWSMINLWLFRS